MRQGTSIHQSIIHLLPHIQGKVARAPAQSEKLWPPTPQQPASAYPRKHTEIPRPAERYNLAHSYEPFSPCTTAVKCWSELLSPILLTVCVDRISRHSHAVGRPPPLWPQDLISTFCGWCNSVGGLQLSLDRFTADCSWNEKYHHRIWGHDTQPGKGGVPNWSEEEV